MVELEKEEEQHYWQEYAHCEGGKCSQCAKCYRNYIARRLPMIGVQRPSRLNPVIVKDECMMYVSPVDCREDAKELIKKLMKVEYDKLKNMKEMKRVKRCDFCRHEEENCWKQYTKPGTDTDCKCVNVQPAKDDVTSFVKICKQNAEALTQAVVAVSDHLGFETTGEVIVSYALMTSHLLDIISAAAGIDRQGLQKDFCDALEASYVPFATSKKKQVKG